MHTHYESLYRSGLRDLATAGSAQAWPLQRPDQARVIPGAFASHVRDSVVPGAGCSVPSPSRAVDRPHHDAMRRIVLSLRGRLGA